MTDISFLFRSKYICIACIYISSYLHINLRSEKTAKQERAVAWLLITTTQTPFDFEAPFGGRGHFPHRAYKSILWLCGRRSAAGHHASDVRQYLAGHGGAVYEQRRLDTWLGSEVTTGRSKHR